MEADTIFSHSNLFSNENPSNFLGMAYLAFVLLINFILLVYFLLKVSKFGGVKSKKYIKQTG